MLLSIAFGMWIILIGVLVGTVTNWDLNEMLPLGIPALVLGPIIILLSIYARFRFIITATAWLHLFISLALTPLAIPAAWIYVGAETALIQNALYILLFIIFPVAVIVARHREKKRLKAT